MWLLDNVRLFAQDIPEESKQQVTRLQPLEGPTVHQIFGYESPVFRLNAVVVGTDDIDTLRSMSRDAAIHTLSGAWDYYKEVIVVGMAAKPRNKVTWQNIRQDLDCDSPVYDVDLELYEDE